MPAALIDQIAAERVGVTGKVTAEDLVKLVPIVVHLGGQFLADPNEFNGWGVIGPFDDTNAQDLGNVGAAVNRVAGGYVWPFDLRLKRFYAWHRDNNTQVEPWGWRLVRQAKTDNSNTVTNVDMLREVTGVGATGIGPRDYPNTNNQLTDVTTFADDVLPAGETLVLGIETPTADTTNRYVQVMSGFLAFERV